MANAELNVILSAEGKQLSATMQKAEKDVQGLEKELASLKPAFDQVDKSVTKSASTLKSAASATNQFVKGVKLSDEALKKLQPSSNASAQSLLNLGRVAQDAPFGILGIANNINPLLESFQRLQKETGSTKTALKSLVSGLTGAGGLGLAVSVVSSLLIVFGDKLFGAKEASKASEEALRSFGEALEGVKDGVKSLSDELQFTNQLGGINVKIRGGGDVQDLLEQSVAQRVKTTKLEAQRDKLKSIGDQIAKNTELSDKDRIDAEIKYFDSLKSINSEIIKSEQDQSIIYRRIALQRVEDLKKANEDALKLNDKFIDDTIARAKRLSSFINKTTIRFAPFELDPETTKFEQFKEALNFIQRGLNDRSSFSIKPQVLVENPVLIKSQAYFASLAKEAEGMFKDIQEEINKLTKRNPIIIRAERVEVTEKARGAEFFQSLGIASADENAPQSLLTDTQKAAVNLAGVMNQTVIPAFNGLFDAIKAGENPIKAFFQSLGQALQQLIQKLIQAAIQALILSAITGGSTSFGKAFKSIIGFKAEGGPVFANKPYVVGERGPELFIPQGGGKIIPNNEMNSGLQGITGGMQNLRLSAVLRGSDLVLSNNRTFRSQNRNG
jgi:tetratricopeptide (TPR) repeat protein